MLFYGLGVTERLRALTTVRPNRVPVPVDGVGWNFKMADPMARILATIVQ